MVLLVGWTILNLMIPTMILFGFVLGRWWKVTVPLAAVTWPLLLVTSDSNLDRSEMATAAILGLANAAVGAALYLAAVVLVGMVARSLHRS